MGAGREGVGVLAFELPLPDVPLDSDIEVGVDVILGVGRNVDAEVEAGAEIDEIER